MEFERRAGSMVDGGMMGDGMMPGVGIAWQLVVVALGLALSALVKFLRT
ncbi:hypothetical protein [Alterinioella nitratireducens]|nr:hypothetical protein [Alterinioella nitratireducens]NPD20959.1 hypothetical protein [Alterinioella nitratireducens]